MRATRPPERARQQRAIDNDARILGAAEAVLADDGWEDTSVLRVAERAGLSRRAVLNRYGDRIGVTAAAWIDRLGPTLVPALVDIMRTAEVPAPIDPVDVESALRPFIDPDRGMRAASEVLIVSSYLPDLRDAVGGSLTALDEWLVPQGNRRTRAQAARSAFLASLALGMLIESRAYPDGLDIDLRDDLADLASALDARVRPRRLPATTAEHLDDRVVLEPDPALASLLAATLEQVGDLGYDAATIDRIAYAAGCTSGLIFSRYANKRDLVLDATNRMLADAQARNFALQQQLSEAHSPGIADATMTREFMHPARRRMRTITLEQYRLSWHDPEMLATFVATRSQVFDQWVAQMPERTAAQVRGRAFIAMARGIGLGLLANLRPDTAALPHDVVSVPLVDGIRTD